MHGGAVVVGSVEVLTRGRRAVLWAAGMSCCWSRRGGATSAVVGASSRDAEPGSDVRDPATTSRGVGGGAWPSLLIWVLEDQSRGVPHLHFVLGHTTALEKAFARAFFRELKSAAYVQGLGHTSTYERAVLEQGKYEAGRLRNYVSKLARYLSKRRDGAAEFLFRHTGERVFYVAPWLRGSRA